MKGCIAILVAICIIGIPLVLVAQEKPLKIGIIDSQRVIQNSVEGKKFINYIEGKQKEKAAEIEAMRTKFQKDWDQFQRQMGSLSDEARIRKQSELNRRRTDLERFNEDANAEMRAILSERRSQLEKKFMPVVQQLAKEKGFSIILQANESMLYVDSSVDITDEVISRFDQAVAATSKPPTQ